MLKRLLISATALALASTLGACSGVESVAKAASTPVGVTTQAQALNTIVVLKSGYGVAVRAATAYVKQPPCGLAGSPGAPLCSDTATVLSMSKLQGSTGAAINAAEELAKKIDPDMSILSAAIAGAQSSFQAFNEITAKNPAGK